MKKQILHTTKLFLLAIGICVATPIYIGATNTSSTIVNSDKNAKTVVKTFEDLEKDLAGTCSKNDILNDKISKTNNKVISTVLKLQNRKGVSKKRLKIFAKNENAIAEKTDTLTKAVESLKDNADRIDLANKKLDELLKPETKENKDGKSDVKSDSKMSIIKEAVITPYAQLEYIISLQTDRNKLLLETLDLLNEIWDLLP